ncbi:MAG: acetyl-CoA hydrolase/transferase C-terminal domain-containing protein [Anaerostipes sp.]|jgi:acyl-CoA hydrolase|nr:acetyl-CoA hydrolase/transferase C-terminal domain-containing protein [Anaerostipes sp.]
MKEWEERYQKKVISFDEAANKIKDNDRVWMSPCNAAPIQFIETLQKRAMDLHGVKIVSGQMLVPFDFLKSSEYKEHMTYETVFYGVLERKLYKYGNININSAEFSQLDKILEDVYDINVVVADVSEPDEDGYMYLGPMGVCITPKAFELSDLKIVQVNKHQPKVRGNHVKIHVDEVDFICEGDHPLPEFPLPPFTEKDKKIADMLLEEIPDGSTIQIGLGGLSNAVGYGLKEKKNLSIHAEMITECIMHLYESGAITGKIEAALGLGTNELAKFCAEHVDFAPFWEINDPYRIAEYDSLISINQGLMSDLTGQVCSESVGHKQVSGIGGQVDFVRGASMSKGGKSFLCIYSTSENDGKVTSNIVLDLPKGMVVTTPRVDVMYIATEYGIANLKNKPIADRVKEMIKIAHPDFREQLHQQALDAGLLFD